MFVVCLDEKKQDLREDRLTGSGRQTSILKAGARKERLFTVDREDISRNGMLSTHKRREHGTRQRTNSERRVAAYRICSEASGGGRHCRGLEKILRENLRTKSSRKRLRTMKQGGGYGERQRKPEEESPGLQYNSTAAPRWQKCFAKALTEPTVSNPRWQSLKTEGRSYQEDKAR